MNAKRIRIKTKYLSETDEDYAVSGKVTLIIPKSYVIKTGNQELHDYTTKSGKLIEWTNLYIDPDFFKHGQVIAIIRKLKNENKLFVYGRKTYGIIWDYVINRLYSRPLDVCFYCDQKLKSKGDKRFKKTKDHLIPKVIVEAYGFYYIDDNTVPCCFECNQEKASLHPYIFREKVKHKIQYSRKPEKWKRILKTLNKILIEKHDIFK